MRRTLWGRYFIQQTRSDLGDRFEVGILFNKRAVISVKSGSFINTTGNFFTKSAALAENDLRSAFYIYNQNKICWEEKQNKFQYFI